MYNPSQLPSQLSSKVLIDSNGCWLWTSGLFHCGYSQIRWKSKTMRAHSVIYTLLVGAIPPGLVFDHLCKVRRCVNPEHLEPVTQRENILRGNGTAAINARKTHCPKGHPYSGSNLKVTNYGKINRTCVTCRKANSHRLYVRKLEAERLVQIGVQPL